MNKAGHDHGLHLLEEIIAVCSQPFETINEVLDACLHHRQIKCFENRESCRYHFLAMHERRRRRSRWWYIRHGMVH